MTLVLIVEDNPVDSLIMEEIVKEAAKDVEDLQVITCETAERAEFICESSSPALIISDIHLPGEDGYQLCKNIRAKGSPCSIIPFLMVSSDSNLVEVVLKSMAAGAYAFDAKPILVDKFIADVRMGLGIAKAQFERLDLSNVFKTMVDY